jgi:hypothetical protein
MRKILVFLVMAVMSLACVGSALQVPSPTVTPEPTLTPVPVPVASPELVRHIYKVSVDTLEIRAGAGETWLNIGYLHSGDSVTVYAVTEQTTLEKCSKWADIGDRRWVCFDRLERVAAEGAEK